MQTLDSQKLNRVSTGLDKLTDTVNDLVIVVKQGFDEQGKAIAVLQNDTAWLKNEVAQNGDTLTTFMFKFDVESAANQEAHRRFENRIDQVDIRLDHVDGRLDGIDRRLDSMDERLDGIDERLDGIDERLDGIDGRLDGIDGRLDGMNGQLERTDSRLSRIETHLTLAPMSES